MVDLTELNDAQREAVTSIDGIVATIAGAGSGKTRCIAYRIAYMLEQGIPCSSILSITFTNKAANEMKERIRSIAGDDTKGIWMGTFHSVCLRILRQHAKLLGYDNFVVYDAKDSLKLASDIYKEFKDQDVTVNNIDKYDVAGYISMNKAKCIFPAQAMVEASTNEDKLLSKMYEAYQKKLIFSNAMDFDDLLLNVVGLFNEHPTVAEKYQDKFKYVLVDECQDLNDCQYRLLTLFSMKHKNIFTVGDHDQSIFAFRFANPGNFSAFVKKRADKIIKIETNYRSTDVIVNSSNSVIEKNEDRLDKTCVADRKGTAKIDVYTLCTDFSEASLVASIVQDAMEERDVNPKDIAILYRVGAMSRLIELELLKRDIPYNVVSGTKFMDRREVKDLVSYIKFILNPFDTAAFSRAITAVKNGVGEATVQKLVNASCEAGISILEQIDNISIIPRLTKNTKQALADFASFIRSYQAKFEEGENMKRIYNMMVAVYKDSGYQDYLLENPDDVDRNSNVEDFISLALNFEETVQADMRDFLDNMSLSAETDNISDNSVNLMTVHSAKGLEFKEVILVGLNEGLFPHFLSSTGMQLEEERRLFYVAMTRAKDKLYITNAKERMRNNVMEPTRPSRFLYEIPKKYINHTELI